MAKWIEVTEDGIKRLINVDKIGKITAPTPDEEEQTVYIEFDGTNVSDITVSEAYATLKALLTS